MHFFGLVNGINRGKNTAIQIQHNSDMLCDNQLIVNKYQYVISYIFKKCCEYKLSFLGNRIIKISIDFAVH